ncbi:MAG: CcdB family protein [Sulfitobacter sp.]
MSKYDLHPTRAGKSYLLDLQTDLLEVQRTRMMVPVLPAQEVPQRVKALHPMIDVEGERFVLATHLMGAVPLSLLLPPIGNLSDRADEFTRAINLLFQGY